MDIPLLTHLALHDEPDGQGDIGAGVHRQAGVNRGGAGHHDNVGDWRRSELRWKLLVGSGVTGG